ncbi:MAG: PAS domain-containing protein [Alphaproteobacteria bacterium]|jgi:hypothetical protein|nr:PAS domain-containing protein [Alphaproteobacteria bacterium]
MNFDPDRLETRQIRAAYDYWRAKCGDNGLPRRGDVDPAEIIGLLPHTLLVDVSHDPLDFSFRLVGTEVVRRYGKEFTGKRLTDLDLDGLNRQIFEEYALTVQRRTPEYFVDEYVMANGKVMHFERILMPLSDDGETVNMLFGVQIAINGTRFDTDIHRV